MRTQLSTEYLDVDLLSKLPNLEMRARYLVSGFLSGLHKSPYRGSSVEFKEYRDYQPGDELKQIDWKAYGRTDRLQIRLREDETNMSAYLLLDKSASMNYKGPDGVMTKWDYSRSIVAAFLLFLQRQRDSVALGFVGHGLEDFVRSSSKSSHFHQMMKNLHCDASADESNLAEAMSTIVNQVRSRSIVMVVSDFYTDADELKSAVAQLRHSNCEILFFHVLDPREICLDFDESVLLQDLETKDKLVMSPDLLKKDYEKKMLAHIKSVSDLVRSYGGDYLLLRTDEVPVKALGAYLSMREAKK